MFLSAWLLCCCCCCWPRLFWPPHRLQGQHPPLPLHKLYCCCWLKGVSLGSCCTPEIVLAFLWGHCLDICSHDKIIDLLTLLSLRSSILSCWETIWVSMDMEEGILARIIRA